MSVFNKSVHAETFAAVLVDTSGDLLAGLESLSGMVALAWHTVWPCCAK